MAPTDIARQKLSEILSTVGELPAAPAVVNMAMGLTSNLQSSVDDISRFLSADQSLAARVLKLSNSPYYGRAKRVKTLPEAIIVLGFDTVRSILMAVSTHDMFKKKDSGIMVDKLWRHSLSTAIASRQIAIAVNHPEKEEAYIAGLMHDIGKLVMIEKLPELYRLIVEEIERCHVDFASVETRVLRFDHTDVASILLNQWLFPHHLIQGIVKHHKPPSFSKDGAVPIAQIVNLGNHMAKQLKVAFDDEYVTQLASVESAWQLSFAEDKLSELFDEVGRVYRAEVRMFEAGT